MAAPPAEITYICIDNSSRLYERPNFEAQIKAIEFYCETKFKCNPTNLVGLFTMTLKPPFTRLSPTNDLQEILRSLREIHYCGEVQFTHALEHTWSFLRRASTDRKKSLLMFVGRPLTSLQYRTARIYGTELRKSGIAVDVVNLYVSKLDIASLPGYSVFNSEYLYARKALDVLCNGVDHNDSSHMVDVADPSSVCDILSNTILKKDLLYLGKKHQIKAEENINVKQDLELSRNEKNKAAAHDEYVEPLGIQIVKPKLERVENEKNKSSADDEYVQAPGMEYCKQYPTKKTPRISGKKNQKRAEENVNVKQELELSRNEKNKAAAHDEYVEPLGFQFVELKLERFQNEKNKSAADDEYVQVPGIKYCKQYPTKKTPHISGKKNQKRAEENVNVKQELEVSRDEKNEAAAHDEYVKPLGIQFVEPKLEQFQNEKNKSAADDAPGIKYGNLSKKKSRKKNRKKPRENV